MKNGIYKGGGEMTITFSDFLARFTSSPALMITVALTLGVILVNGWTDALDRGADQVRPAVLPAQPEVGPAQPRAPQRRRRGSVPLTVKLS